MQTSLSESQIYDKLHEAETQAASSDERLSHEQVMESARKLLTTRVTSARINFTK